MNRARDGILRGHASVHIDAVPTNDDEPERMDYDEREESKAQVNESHNSTPSTPTSSPLRDESRVRPSIRTIQEEETEEAEEEVLVNKEITISPLRSTTRLKRSFDDDYDDDSPAAKQRRDDNDDDDDDDEEIRKRNPFLDGPFALDVIERNNDHYGHFIDNSTLTKTHSVVEPLWRTAAVF